jgi:hypothetical protein
VAIGPPTSLQNWLKMLPEPSNFPSELAYKNLITPPTSLQNWPKQPTHASNFPSELAVAYLTVSK